MKIVANLIAVGCAVVILCAASGTASAHYGARGVGLGVAAGGSYSPTKLRAGQVEHTAGTGFAWGFFVDIPLLETFYISPAAMLYELKFTEGKASPVTDIDLNFKFIVPLNRIRVGAGFTVGLSNAAGVYEGHWGGLGYLSLKLVPTLDVFAMAQYKKLMREEETSIDSIYGFVGTMFYF